MRGPIETNREAAPRSWLEFPSTLRSSQLKREGSSPLFFIFSSSCVMVFLMSDHSLFFSSSSRGLFSQFFRLAVQAKRNEQRLHKAQRLGAAG